MGKDRDYVCNSGLLDVIQVNFVSSVLLMNEVGLNWKKVSADNQWIERTTGKLHGRRAVFAHNITELSTTDTIQYGGGRYSSYSRYHTPYYGNRP